MPSTIAGVSKILSPRRLPHTSHSFLTDSRRRERRSDDHVPESLPSLPSWERLVVLYPGKDRQVNYLVFVAHDSQLVHTRDARTLQSYGGCDPAVWYPPRGFPSEQHLVPAKDTARLDTIVTRKHGQYMGGIVCHRSIEVLCCGLDLPRLTLYCVALCARISMGHAPKGYIFHSTRGPA